jgi:hypothetical protein
MVDTDAEVKKIGRPSEYTVEMADVICSQLADGDSMRTVCKPDHMPNKTTVFRWIRTYEEFRNQYARAKEESADSLTDEMLDISDNANNDWMEAGGDSEGYKLNGENIQRSKLRIDTRKWLASKLKPKKYGDKIQQEISGNINLTDLSEDELDRKLSQLINAQPEG